MIKHNLNQLILTTLVFLTVGNFLHQPEIFAQIPQSEESKVTFTVTTYDGLELPAQVVFPKEASKKVVLFINGSTPSDEKGNMAGSWDDNGKKQIQPQVFYQRIIETFPDMGYTIATMAKRSFTHHLRIPRPTLDEIALDEMFYINELKERGILKSEADLVVVGYSEGSVVASKLLGILKTQPSMCVLLGTAGDKFDYINGKWEDWSMVDVLKRKGVADDVIQGYFNKFKLLQTEIVKIDEDTFENVWKKTGKPLDFAPWESYHIDKEFSFYDPVPNLLAANTKTLICIGSNDTAMPAYKAVQLFMELNQRGFTKGTIKVIEDEVHQYNKRDVFFIMDSWITSDGANADFDPALATAHIPKKEYTVKSAKGKITVDGELNESAWKNAPFTDNFVIHSDGKEPVFPTKAQMLYDDTNLYIAFTVSDNDVWTTMTNHDEHLWKQTAVEIFIDPDGDSENYLELQANPLGATLDILMNKEYTRAGAPDFEATINGFTAVATVDGTVDDTGGDKGWVCELAIPFSELVFIAPSMNFPPKANDTWRVNLCRIRTDRSDDAVHEASSWNQTDYRGFHAPDLFGKIVFGE